MTIPTSHWFLPTPQDAVFHLLKLVSRGVVAHRDGALLADLLARIGTQGLLAETAIRHDLLPTLAWELGKLGMMSSLVPAVAEHLEEQLAYSQARARILAERATSLQGLFTAKGIPTAVTKGLPLAVRLYGDIGARRFGDVDFMIQPGHRDLALTVLAEAGLRPGQYDWRTRRVVPLERSQQIKSWLPADHLPHHLEGAPGAVVGYIKVDVATSLTWDAAEWQVPTSVALSDVTLQDLQGAGPVAVLGDTWHFIFVALHLFREAWFDTLVPYRTDVTLRKFGDVARFWRELGSSGQDKVVAAARLYGLQMPMAWVGHHASALYGEPIVATLAEDVDPGSLSSIITAAGPVRWSGDMSARLKGGLTLMGTA